MSTIAKFTYDFVFVMEGLADVDWVELGGMVEGESFFF
jgi:hypothetical protein